MQLAHSDEMTRANPNIVLKAVTSDGMALQYATDFLKKDLGIVRAVMPLWLSKTPCGATQVETLKLEGLASLKTAGSRLLAHQT